MSDPERRYTDQEVALVLARAADLEERRADGPSGGGRGLTLRELHEIAREVGLSPAVIDEAVSALGPAPARPSLLGAPLSHRLVRGVPGRLDEEDLRRLIRVVEDQVDDTGTVTEALGVVRWTTVSHGQKFDPTMQVSLSSHGDETQIQVVRRYPQAIRALLHLLPPVWGAAIGGAVVSGAGLAIVPAVGVVVAAGGLALGFGRSVWRAMSRRSARKAEEVAGALAAEARKLAEP